MKRYNLNLEEELYDRVESLAKEREVPIISLLRKYIRAGLEAENGEERLNDAFEREGTLG